MASTTRYGSLKYFVDKLIKSNFRVAAEFKGYKILGSSNSATIIDERGNLWNLTHVGVVISYALKLSSNFEFGDELHGTLSHLDNLALSCHKDEGHYNFFRKAIRFIPRFQILFQVPKFKQWSDVVEVVADFFNFLLIILNPRTDAVFSIDKYGIAPLHKELSFLLAFLGDTPLQYTKYKEVRDLLMKIGATAQDVGDFVYSCFFRNDRVSNNRDIGDYISVEMERIEEIKTYIKELCTKCSHWSSCDKPETAVVSVESLFIVDSFISDIEYLINVKMRLVDGVMDEIQALHQQMTSSLSLLRSINLNIWEIDELRKVAVQIRDAAYEAEYLIRSFVTEDASFTWYLALRLPNVIEKMKCIVNSLRVIKGNYDMGDLQISEDVNKNREPQTRGASTLNEDVVVGFDDKATEILDQLVGGPEHLQIIVISGMPGLGKTTLANKLYNDPLVNHHFDKHSWSVVSQMYQKNILSIEILRNLDSSVDQREILKMKEEMVMTKIYQTLKGNRYLIVMDDVWTSDMLNDFRNYFPNDKNGSRILITSRINDVSPVPSIVHTIPFLSKDQCWELLAKKVFIEEPYPLELEEIGRQIAADCDGLPLAVVVTAGILATMDKDTTMWRKVKESLDSHRLTNCLKILERSYRHLPDHLKPCYLYFGMFPDKIVRVSDLVAKWNVEGFIPRKQEERPEIIARKYLMELVDRSLVMVYERSSTGGVKTCGIHDLLHDLCIMIAEEENFMTCISGEKSIYEKHHHLRGHKNSQKTAWLSFGLHVRSFSGFHLYPSCLLNMKLLNNLILTWDNFNLAVKDIFHLRIHVRYLNISDEWLLASIVDLANLEYLIMNDTSKTFPPSLLRMPKLRYLICKKVFAFNEDIDIDISGTNNLEHISGVCVSTSKDEMIVKSCPRLRKLKCTCTPIFVNQQVGHRFPNFGFLERLESLNMTFIKWENIIISCAISIPSNIKKLTLCNSKLSWDKMSIIGKLPKLEVLKLLDHAFLGDRWETKDDEFQELRFMKLDSIPFKQWDVASSDHFPRLQRLLLCDCFLLQEIPREIGFIPTLQQIDIRWCRRPVVESALRIREELQEETGEVLKVIITKRNDQN